MSSIGFASATDLGLHCSLATSEHFSTAELKCPHCGANLCTPELLDALERFRLAVGSRPVKVNSAYRCMIHNAAVGGKPKSEHMLGLAADIHVDGMTPAEMEKAARTIPIIRGIGRADHQNYIHIDVRNTLTLAQWCYDREGKTCSYFPPVTAASNIVEPPGSSL